MCGEIRGQRPHGATPLPTSNRQELMEKTITLTSDEIYNITSAINDRIILLEETISSHNDIPITHKRLKEFNEIKAKLNY